MSIFKHLIWIVLIIPFEVIAKDRTRFDSLIRKHSQTYAVDFSLVKAMIRQESNFKVKAVSSANAQGLMQMIPATAKRFGVTDVYSPDQNIRGGTKYIKWLLDRYDGNLDFALAAYNAGEGKVDRYQGIPPYRETRHYVKRVKRFYHEYQNQAGNPRSVYSRNRISKQDVAAIADSLKSIFKDTNTPAKKTTTFVANHNNHTQAVSYFNQKQPPREVGSVTRVYATNSHRPALGYTRIRAADHE